MTVTKIEELYTVFSPKGRCFEMKNRPYYGLSFCTDGQITYTHKGKTYISDPDHAVLLPKGQSYTLYGDKKGTFPVIDFQCTGFNSDTFLVIPLQNKEIFLKNYEYMCAHRQHPLKQMSIFYEMLERLTARHNSEAPSLEAALRHIDRHWQEPGLSNRQVADAAGISEVYLRKLFLKQLGTTPKQYILDRRLEWAKQLLRSGAHSVTEVAEECGFSGVYHFCRIFKEKTGYTPKEYTRQNRIQGI